MYRNEFCVPLKNTTCFNNYTDDLFGKDTLGGTLHGVFPLTVIFSFDQKECRNQVRNFNICRLYHIKINHTYVKFVK